MNKSEFFYLLTGFLGGFFLRHFFHDIVNNYPKDEIEEDSQNNKEFKEKEIEIKTAPFAEIQVKRIFKASRMGDPLTPDEVIFDTKGITFNVKSILSSTESFVLYSDISGVEIFESLFFSTIIIKPKARSEIKIENFYKSDAKLIKNFITERLF